jgi:hypothetical protein
MTNEHESDITPPAHLAGRVGDWKTDWSRHTVPLEELFSGGPPRDGIPPLDEPRFISIEEAAGQVAAKEPVVVFEHGEEARAYPLAILMWHEIVNDEVGGQPVVITYCPLCNTALAFDRRLGDRVLDFGTSGLLRHSDLVMWDRQTESLWQQVTGEAIVGTLAGGCFAITVEGEADDFDFLAGRQTGNAAHGMVVLHRDLLLPDPSFCGIHLSPLLRMQPQSEV